MSQIIKPLDKEKHGDHIDVMYQGLTFKKRMHKEIEKFQQESHHSKRVPFCRVCARIDLAKKQDDTWEKKGSRGSPDDIKVNIDLTKYTGKDQFEEVKVDPAYEKVRVQGVVETQHVGHYHVYKCKERGCNVEILVPLEEKKK
jgi:hypothetical protein